MQANILNLFNSATASQLAEGLNWYQSAHNHAVKLSEQYNVSLSKVCGVISALSPATNWHKNIKDTEELLKGNSTHKFSTYGQNVLKAYKILNASLEMDIELFFNLKTGAKTFNFYKNILNPKCINYVTIDRHAYAIWVGSDTGSGAKAINLKLYREIAADYIAVAEQVGITPLQLQAVTWVVYREQFVNEMHLSAPF
jgi:hypothetical protein